MPAPQTINQRIQKNQIMKKRSSLIFFLVLALSAALTGCYYDIEAELYPLTNNACDTTGVTYNGTVAPLMQAQCVSCHSASFASGNIALDSYNGVKASAQNGSLYGSINYSSGFSPMPQGGNKMDACSIKRIKAWIDAGAPNN